MRIGYVTADHGIPVFGEKGASIHIQQLTRAFTAVGNCVEILTPRTGGHDESFCAQVLKVRTDEVSETQLEGNEGESKRLAKETRYLQIGKAMEQAIVDRHAEAPFDFLYERYSLWSAAGVRAARRLGIPCMLEVNAPLVVEQQRFRELVLADEAVAIEHEAFAGADALVAVSAEVRRYAIEHGAHSDRSVVIPNGVDLSAFNPQVEPAPIERAPDGFVLGFIGSLKAWHDIGALLDAFRILAAEDASYHLLVIGDGPLRPWIDGYVRGASLDERVTVTGWVPYADVPRVLRRVDVAVAPYPEMDGFYFSPLKLYEYLALGRPVVASAIGQVRDAIEDGTTGLLARPGDAVDLARQIRRLRHDDALRMRVGTNGAESARTLSWENNALRMLEIVETLRRSERT